MYSPDVVMVLDDVDRTIKVILDHLIDRSLDEGVFAETSSDNHSLRVSFALAHENKTLEA